MENKDIEEIEKEVVKSVKGYLNTNAIVLSTLVAGASMYLLGRSKGKGLGHAMGRAEGYEQGVRAIGDIFKKLDNTLDIK